MKTSEWTAALRSGDYKQGRRMLQSKGEFCCLGVLCEVKGLSKKERYGLIEYVFGPGKQSHGVIPVDYLNKMLEDLDLSTLVHERQANENSLAGELMAMNDIGRPFSEIADYIDQVQQELAQ